MFELSKRAVLGLTMTRLTQNETILVNKSWYLLCWPFNFQHTQLTAPGVHGVRGIAALWHVVGAINGETEQSHKKHCTVEQSVKIAQTHQLLEIVPT